MSAKYKQDNYLMLGFDEYGGKVFSRVTDRQHLTAAQEEGRAMVDAEKIASFAICRVLYNSIDAAKADRWMPKEEPITLDPGPLGCVTRERVSQ